MSASVPTSPHVLARNAALNAAGHLLPLLLAIPLLPYVLRGLGTERFAVLTLAWTVIGYFGFLDLGIGRAATKFMAGLLGGGRRDELSRVVWSSLAIQILLGAIGALSIIALSAPLARHVLRIAEPVLFAETHRTLLIVALAVPLVLVSGTLSGVLEAHQRFELLNLVRLPTSCAMFAVPALGVMLGWSLSGIALGFVVARAGAVLCFAVLAVHVTGGLPAVRPHSPTLRQLFAFGGWLTISMVAGPVLAYAERFLISGFRSLTELAYYAVAFEIAVRTTLLAAAASVTLFPAFSFAQRSGGPIDQLFQRPLRLLLLLQWPMFVVLWLFPTEILTAWMNARVATAAAPALRLLALSFFFNGMAHIAIAGVLGLGRADLKAKLDMVEVPFFVATAALLIGAFGVTGAAAAKLLVTILDTAMLFVFARRLGAPAPVQLASLRRRPGATITAASVVLATGAALLAPLAVRLVTAVLAIFILSTVLWKRVLEPGDRAAVLGLLTRARLKEAI